MQHTTKSAKQILRELQCGKNLRNKKWQKVLWRTTISWILACDNGALVTSRICKKITLSNTFMGDFIHRTILPWNCGKLWKVFPRKCGKFFIGNGSFWEDALLLLFNRTSHAHILLITTNSCGSLTLPMPFWAFGTKKHGTGKIDKFQYERMVCCLLDGVLWSPIERNIPMIPDCNNSLSPARQMGYISTRQAAIMDPYLKKHTTVTVTITPHNSIKA